MYHLRAPSTQSNPATTHDLRQWRTWILDGILRGILVLWLFVIIEAVNNVVEAYLQELSRYSELHETHLLLAVMAGMFYVITWGLLVFITFNRKLNYELRASVFLCALYITGTIDLVISSLGGDGRILFFAFITLSAVFFERRMSLMALGLSLLTMIIVGWMQITGIIFVPPELQVNSTDAGAWVSGGILLLTLSVAALISVKYILRALENSLSQARLRATQLGRLYAASQDMASNLAHPRMLLAAIIRHMTEAVEATSGHISSFNQKEDTLSVLAEYCAETASAAERKEDPFRVYTLNDYPSYRRGIVRGIVTTLQADDQDLSASERKQFKIYGIRSVMFVPVMAHGVLQGCVEIRESRRRREFSLNDINLLQAMAGQAAAIIENSRLFEELEQREARFRALIENSAEGIAILNADGVFTYMSPAEEKLIGYDHREMIGQTAFLIAHPEDVERVRAAFSECARIDNHLVTVEHRARHANGSWRTLEVMLKNLLADPNVNGVVANFRDISERKQAEAEIRRYAAELVEAYDNTLSGWARALEFRDELTEGHTRRVTDLTLRLARAMGLDEEQIVHIRRGAILHDIGKMAIPDAILGKSGKLTLEEQRIMRRHPQLAYDMLSPISFLRPALDIPLCHHEHWDGKGYPRRLEGEDIPLSARIFAVADVWDALTSDRPYRPAWTADRAREYIAGESGKYFDPHVVEIFFSLNSGLK